MAGSGIRTSEGPKGAPETASIAQPGGWRRAITKPLHMLTGILTPRYQSTFESTQAPAPAEKPSLWGGVTGFVGGIRDSLAGGIKSAADTIKEKGLLGAASQWAGQAWDGVRNTISNLSDSIVSGFKSAFGFVSRIFQAFTTHQRDIDKKVEERKREEDKREDRRLLAKQEDAKHLEDTAQRARALASAQQFQAQQGVIDKITVTGPDIQIDNAALERQKERARAQKA